jgi:hypothetical protein
MDRRLGSRTKILTVGDEDTVGFKFLAALGRVMGEKPPTDEDEAALVAEIRRERPALHACMLEAVRYDVNSRSWELMISDPSFARVADSGRLEREPLFMPRG